MNNALQLLKQNAPKVYAFYVSKKTIELNTKLNDLRDKYKDTPDEDKYKLTLEANEIKNQLKELNGNN